MKIFFLCLVSISVFIDSEEKQRVIPVKTAQYEILLVKNLPTQFMPDTRHVLRRVLDLTIKKL